MGVCTVERPVMHWQQSARFLGPSRERSPTLPSSITGQCSSGNNNHLLHRPCSSCTDSCEHSDSKIFTQSAIVTESCRSYRTPDRSIFDESSGMGYLGTNRIECTDIRSGGTSCLQFKSEPQRPNTPESPSDICTGPDDCAGCGQLIQDRFYLSAVEKRWHACCLQCSICRQLLEGETSCFSRDGNIYCKSDYYRMFGTRRCSRCMASISSSELVMRARHLVFHVRCFSCSDCNTPLTKGDQFGMRDSSVFCRLHYEIMLEPTTVAPASMSCQYPEYGRSPSHPPSPNELSTMKATSASFFGTGQMPGLPQPPRQKGRPRKRKPKDIEAMTANLDLNTEYLDLGFGRGGPMSASARAKRMRTSFKHHQLRTMKSYFAINHNPDAKDLKQLSQKTGLPKRVLQVWFQNARAKWRRMMMKQEGKGGGSEKGDNSLDLDSYSHSPGFMLGAGPPSPNSID